MCCPGKQLHLQMALTGFKWEFQQHQIKTAENGTVVETKAQQIVQTLHIFKATAC